MDSICRETPKGVRSEQRWSPRMLSWICWAALVLHGAMMSCGALKLCLSDSWLCKHLNACTPPLFTTTSLHFVLLTETWVGLSLGVHWCSLIAYGNTVIYISVFHHSIFKHLRDNTQQKTSVNETDNCPLIWYPDISQKGWFLAEVLTRLYCSSYQTYSFPHNAELQPQCCIPLTIIRLSESRFRISGC